MFCYWTTWNSPESLTSSTPRLRDQHQPSWFVLLMFKEEIHSENNFRASFFPSLVWASFQGDSYLLLFRNGSSLTRTAFQGESSFLQEGAVLGKELHLSGGKCWGKILWSSGEGQKRQWGPGRNSPKPTVRQWGSGAVGQGLWLTDSVVRVRDRW